MPLKSNYMMPTAMITGCCLKDGGGYIHGDLHAFGNLFIFNACLNAEGEAARRYGGEPTSNKVVSCEECFIFERRGVIIFSQAQAVFNQAAKDYVNAH